MTLEDPIQSLKGPSQALETPRGAWGVQTRSVSLCSQQKVTIFFFCQSKEKVSPSPQQREWPPLYAGKSPGCVRGKISKKRAARKVKMQAGLGWEVCGALIPLHRGTDFNKAGSLQGKAAVDSRVLPWQALLLCSLFRVFTFQAL